MENNAIAILERFLDRQQEKGTIGAFYWMLLRGSNLTKNKTADTFIAENRDITDYEESKRLLFDEINDAAASGDTHMHVRIFDNDKLKTAILKKKVIVKKAVSSNNNILGAAGGGILGALLNSNTAIAGQLAESKQDYLRAEKDREIQDLKNENQFLRDNKETWGNKAIAAIKGTFETQEGIMEGMKTIQGVMSTIQMFKNPQAILNGIGGDAPSPAISESDKQTLALKAQFESDFGLEVNELISLLMLFAKHKPKKFELIIQNMAKDCQKIDQDG